MVVADSMRGALKRFARAILDRNVVPWTVGYLAGAWCVLEANAYLADLYHWSETVEWALPVVVGVGTLSVVTAAWFHGAAGWQRVTKTELAIHAGIAVVLVASLAAHPGQAEDPDASELTEVAVLYFKDHSSDQRFRGLTAELTEQIVHRLAQVPALHVRPLTAVLPYRDSLTASIRELGKTLDVGTFVEGSVTTVGDSMRTTAQLFDVATGDHLGSWMLTCPLDNQACVSTAVCERLADSVRVRLGEEVRWRRAAAGANPVALDLYARADVVVDEASVAWEEDRTAGLVLLATADSLLVEAERRDPGWAEPVRMRMGVADLAAQLEGGPGTRNPDEMRRAIDLATRALGMVRDSAPLLEARGGLLFDLGRHSGIPEARELYADAERDLRTAMRLDPERPGARWALSRLLDRQGRFEGAYRLAVEAYERDSFLELDSDILYRLMMASLQLERLEDSRRWCTDGRRLYPTDQSILQGCLFVLASLSDPTAEDLAQAWEITGRFGDQGVGMAERRPAWQALASVMTAAVLAQRGDADSVEAVVRRARSILDGTGPSMRGSARIFEALARHRLGQDDHALRLLAEYASLRPADAVTLAKEWWFRDLWNDPRYRALYTRPTETAGG